MVPRQSWKMLSSAAMATFILVGTLGCVQGPNTHGSSTERQRREAGMEVHYLEYVTTDAEGLIRGFESIHGVAFSDPVPELGNARTATLSGGWKIGVRAPMHEAEEPTVRPYLAVDDLESAVAAAVAGGGELAMPPTEAPGVGRFAIYFQGKTQHGLWQREAAQ